MEQNHLNLCPNCFDGNYLNGVCRRCGYQARFASNNSGRGLAAGTLVKKKYIIGKILGEGGFGITYKAYDTDKRRICAVKEYAPNGMCRRAMDKRQIELLSPNIEEPYLAGLRRFLEESQILSRLGQIPSVVNITDCFKENSTVYLVMEYLEGADLGQIVRASKSRLPVSEVTDIILQVAVSMDVIHTRTKIIHRDISPDNIYITKNRQVKLIDFGSAKQTVTGAQDGFSVVVKLRLSPPEQYSQDMVQGSFTDVYSLAATYYYALTGTNLPTAPDRLMGTNYVPLKQLNLGVPDSVSDAVDHALVLNVDQRTQTMQEFIRGIAPAVSTDKRPKYKSYEAEQLARQREEFLRQEAARRQAEKNRKQQAQQAWEQQQREAQAKQQDAARQREAQARQQEVLRQREAQLRQQEAQARQQEVFRQREAQLRQQEAVRQREAQARQQEVLRQREAQLRQQEARIGQRRQEGLRQNGVQARQQELVHPSGRRPAVRLSNQEISMPYVSVIGGVMAGKFWKVPSGQTVKVGRSAADSDLRIEKPEDLSRIHCLITYVADRGVFRIRDVSSFGVFYNGQRLEKGRDYEFKPPARFALASMACLIEVGVKR